MQLPRSVLIGLKRDLTSARATMQECAAVMAKASDVVHARRLRTVAELLADEVDAIDRRIADAPQKR
jgi:hypothetical protein